MKTEEVKQYLRHLGKTPNKQLGQNFLIDQSVIHAAVESGKVQEGDVVLEVGPGLGVLTRELLHRGARVLAIEQDRQFVQLLEEEIDQDRFHIVHADAVAVDWLKEFPVFSKEKNPSWKFIANLPYAVTSMLLRKALWCANPPQVVEVLIQKEVAERAIGLMGKATKKTRASLLSLMVALSAKSARIVRAVPPRCFYPAPKVQSAVLEIIPMTISERMDAWGIEAEKVMKVAKVGFAHPRKQLASNLVHGDSKSSRVLEKEEIEKMLVSIGLDAKIRAEALTVKDWVALAKVLVE